MGIKIRFLGKFKTVLESKTSLTVDDVYVVTNKISGCLLSFNTAKDLVLITVLLDKIHDGKETESKDILFDDAIKEILDTHDDLFQGLGRLKNQNISLDIDKSIKPVALKQRRIHQ